MKRIIAVMLVLTTLLALGGCKKHLGTSDVVSATAPVIVPDAAPSEPTNG